MYVIIAMFIGWLTKIYPFAITSMFPVVAFPLMNIMTSDKTCSMYFKETLVMFVITIMIALAMEYTKLHTRWAVIVIKFVGSSPRKLHLILIVLTASLSMFVPNAASVTLMYPLTKAILEQLSSQGMCELYEDNNPDIPKTAKRPSKIAICFYLSIAYASSMGGAGNLTGTSTNYVFLKIYEAKFPNNRDDIDFAYYLKYAFPPTVVYIGLMYLMMEFTYMGLFRSNSPEAKALQFSDDQKMAAQQMANDKYEEIGSPSMEQCTVGTLIISMIFFIFFRQPEFITGWSSLVSGKEILNASVATVVIYLIFSLPANFTFLKCWDVNSVGKTPGILTWKYVNSILPWEVVFFIGCGGALAEACHASGLTELLGDSLSNLKNLPCPLSLLISIVLMEMFTNITVSSSVMSVIAPGILRLAVESERHPLYFMLPVGMAGSMAFLMPSATAPNALVSIFANIRNKDLILAGIGPSIASIITIFIFSQSWAVLMFPELMEFPNWINEIPVTTEAE
ncbi:protein I'm not dead yet-like isoform X2 [Eupeodes corollae]|nr:protein I'm not dead yet-like isoform X2 [Eupeodes corollae]